MDVDRVRLCVLDQELVCVGDGGCLAGSQQPTACVVHSLHWVAGDAKRLVHSQGSGELLVGGDIRQLRLHTVDMVECLYAQDSAEMTHLSYESVVQEDVSRSSQHGVGGGVLGLGLQEGVRRDSGDGVVVEFWTQVYQGNRNLKVALDMSNL